MEPRQIQRREGQLLFGHHQLTPNELLGATYIVMFPVALVARALRCLHRSVQVQHIHCTL